MYIVDSYSNKCIVYTLLNRMLCLGLNSLFTDLLNIDDPPNLEAAQHSERDKVGHAHITWQSHDILHTSFSLSLV